MSAQKDFKIKAEIMNEEQMVHALKRIAHQIIEKNDGCSDLVFFGIKKGGVPLANRLSSYIHEFEGVKIPVFELDITMYRDDLSEVGETPIVKSTNVDIDINNKTVVLVDDVIFTGRTVRAALDAVSKEGRAALIQLAVLIDRGHKELPIRADYVGKNVPTSRNESILVKLKEIDGSNSVDLAEIN